MNSAPPTLHTRCRGRSRARALVVLLGICVAVPRLLGAATAPPTTETLHLSGTGEDDTVDWEFRCREGRGCGEWTSIPVPSSWELEGFGAYSYGFGETRSRDEGEYRFRFDVPDHWADRRTWIVFDGVMTDADVRLNGRPLGTHRGAFYPFRFEITEALRFPGPNRLEVHVREESADASINRAERDADYWVFGGIFRPVRLVSHPREALLGIALDPRHDGRLSATVEVSRVASADRVWARVETLEGDPVGYPFGALLGPETATARLEHRIPGVRAWTAETPHLYRLRLRLMAGREVLHETTERFGFRTVETVAGSGLHVNGRKVLLKGINRHTFWPDAGRTTSEAISRRDVALLREMNLNAVRTSHYPPDEHFLDACDELGIYVLDELAGWHDAYDTVAGRLLVEAMVERDRNHPSVVLWANGNEGGWNRKLDGVFRRLDPQGRPVLHPDATFGGFDTEHYPSWEELARRLGIGGRRWPGLARPVATEVVLPTEILHGLYDGGGAAGLESYWHAIRDAPRGGGLFLWAFVDEGVVRTDRGGAIDTAGNRAPDGVVGPFREPEASVLGLREIFSPLEIRLPRTLAATFDGTVPIVSRFDHRVLAGRLHWEWMREGAEGLEPTRSGAVSLPPLAPGEAGTIEIPPGAGEAVALRLRYVDGDGVQRMEWSFGVVQSPLPLEPSAGAARISGDEWVLSSGRSRLVFDRTGILRALDIDGKSWPLTGGYPVPRGADARDAEVSADDSGLRVAWPGTRVGWSLTPTGTARMEYELAADGAEPFRGLGFRFPFASARSVRWLGAGPYRVWGNRLAGSRFGLWRREPNRTVTGESWGYPELPGYYRDLRRLEIDTEDGTLRFHVEGAPFVQIFTPPPWSAPEKATAPFPDADLALLHRIPAIGTKFHTPAELEAGSRQPRATRSRLVTGRMIVGPDR